MGARALLDNNADVAELWEILWWDLREPLSRLFKPFERMAGSTGLEPAASAVTGQRSNQLNYDPAIDGSAETLNCSRTSLIVTDESAMSGLTRPFCRGNGDVHRLQNHFFARPDRALPLLLFALAAARGVG